MPNRISSSFTFPLPATPRRQLTILPRLPAGICLSWSRLILNTSEDLNYSDTDSRVCYEHDNPDARDVELVADTVENWESYDTVLIGYPIWWGIAAWPVDGFIEANDFTGKTVVPLCTPASSGLGESDQLLEEMAGTGTWLDGQRFSSNVSQTDVETWLDGLGLLAE